MALRKGNRVPDSWGVEAEGKETTDANKIMYGGGLLPIGGNELNGKFLKISENREAL